MKTEKEIKAKLKSLQPELKKAKRDYNEMVSTDDFCLAVVNRVAYLEGQNHILRWLLEEGENVNIQS